MTELLFRQDPYQTTSMADVVAHTAEGGVVLDRSVFYPTGGGQPGDAGRLTWSGGQFAIATAIKNADDDVVLVPAEPAPLPPIGQTVSQEIDWDRRFRHMRVHTALHLLSVVVPLPVTGGSIGAEKGRLDFDMPDAPGDKAELEAKLNALVEADHAVTESWITDQDLLDNPGLVKTMSVQPPMGAGQIRLVRIGPEDDPIDLQPCGGTHVDRTGEIGRLRIGKIEKKGARNRRINIHLT